MPKFKVRSAVMVSTLTAQALLLLVFSATAAHAQDMDREGPASRAQFCGDDSATSPTGQVSFDWQSNFVQLSRLGNYYMPYYGDGDSATVPFWENGGADVGYGSDGFHETWYIPRSPLPSGTRLFYRLLNAGWNDHMDSWDQNEGALYGYQMIQTLGSPWTTQQTGMQPLIRYLNSSIFDHRTWLATQTPSGYAADARWDQASGHAMFGYERFGNLTDICSVLAGGYVDNLINAKIRIDFNQIWGNAIGRITWLPTGQQFVREQIGAMVQSTLLGSDGQPVCCHLNPTQSGGGDLYNFSNTRRYAGSPITSRSYSGTNPKSQITEVRPMNYGINPWIGTDPLSPLMWRGTLRKTTTLGFDLGGGTILDNVVKMRLEAERDTGAPPAMTNVFFLNNVFWLSMDGPFGDGNSATSFSLELLTAATGSTQTLQHPTFAGGANEIKVCLTTVDPDCQLHQSPVGTALVISSSDTTFSVGVYGAGTYDELKLTYACDGAAQTGGTCPTLAQAFVLDTFHLQTIATSYTSPEDAYMVLGTRAEVIQRIRQINCVLTGGVNCGLIQ